ncbi:hypothetical protein SDJN03_21860, partial [Cucurbita argyrosperma subsp. sororia]
MGTMTVMRNGEWTPRGGPAARRVSGDLVDLGAGFCVKGLTRASWLLSCHCLCSCFAQWRFLVQNELRNHLCISIMHMFFWVWSSFMSLSSSGNICF